MPPVGRGFADLGQCWKRDALTNDGWWRRQVNFERVWESMQPQLSSLVSGVPQTLTNEKWMEMYSYVALQRRWGFFHYLGWTAEANKSEC